MLQGFGGWGVGGFVVGDLVVVGGWVGGGGCCVCVGDYGFGGLVVLFTPLFAYLSSIAILDHHADRMKILITEPTWSAWE